MSSSNTMSGQLELGPSDDSKLGEDNVVDWDGTDDATNPRNWPNRKRWAHIILVSIFALVT